MRSLKLVALTSAAMIAFAANSVLCRLALAGGHIDAASFSSIRIAAGALVLLVVSIASGRKGSWRPGWVSACSLFAYMACFSFSYQWLSTGTGALILFGAVQLTMISAALFGGERLSPAAWVGLAMAIGGLVYLLLPGISVPDPLGALLMSVAGIAWGIYSIQGRSAKDPTWASTMNFLYALPFALVLIAVCSDRITWDTYGATLAVVSGGVTSGLGYAVWYATLPRLTASGAASVQLSVPAIAAFGGVLLLDESVSLRLIVATILLLGGIALMVWKSSQNAPVLRKARAGNRRLRN